MMPVRLKPAAPGSQVKHSTTEPLHSGNGEGTRNLGITVKVLNFGTLLFLFSDKMLVTRVGNHKMIVRIANREDPDQTASSEAV